MTQARWEIDLGEVRRRLAERQRQLAGLSGRVAARELLLAEIRADVAAFQHTFFSRLGARYVELDSLAARIAELQARQSFDGEGLHARARRARQRAERSAGDYRRYAAPHEEPPPCRVNASPSLKNLYRRIAAEIHPDKAGDEQTRALRNQLMAELNAAYAAGDVGRMQQIRQEWRSSPETVAGTGAETELERLERTIGRLRKKLSALNRRIDRLKRSDLYQMMHRAREANGRGEDLIGKMARDLDQQITLYRCILTELQGA